MFVGFQMPDATLKSGPHRKSLEAGRVSGAADEQRLAEGNPRKQALQSNPEQSSVHAAAESRCIIRALPSDALSTTCCISARSHELPTSWSFLSLFPFLSLTFSTLRCYFATPLQTDFSLSLRLDRLNALNERRFVGNRSRRIVRFVNKRLKNIKRLKIFLSCILLVCINFIAASRASSLA